MKRMDEPPLLRRWPSPHAWGAPDEKRKAAVGRSALLGLRGAGHHLDNAPGKEPLPACQRAAEGARIWRKGLRACCLLPLACALAGCADDELQAPAQSLLHQGVATDIRHNTLMDAAFGTENELIVPGEVYWQAVLPLPQTRLQTVLRPARPKVASASAGQVDPVAASSDQPRPSAPRPADAAAPIAKQAVAVRPREAVRLNDEQVALVVESFPLGAVSASAPAGVPVPFKAQPAHMGVIFFRADAAATAAAAGPAGKGGKPETGAEQWRAVRLVPHVDALMPGPGMPDVQVYRLDASRYLVTYTQTTCQMGACSRWLKGYLLQPEAMRAVFSVRLASSNAEQWADCPARLGLTARADDALAASVRQLHAQAAPVADAAAATAGAASAHSCHAVLGEVHLISRGSADAADVQIRYSGAISDAPGRLRPIAQAQLFRLQGEQLVQIDGAASPVPAQP